ncbi:MAG TPA: amidohydrolase family protein [Bryobacteraceae bacterium]|nr:amidohydrolase family protein [Bryobacteraceae bacterium]
MKPILLALICGALAWGQASHPRILDAHVHHNGDPAFLPKLVEKLEAHDAAALLLVQPKDLESVRQFMAQHPGRLIGLGQIKLDDPQAVALVDRFHAAGFKGLGELTGPKADYHDKRYWPVYREAEKYHMILLFHTGIVNRQHPEIPSDVSSDRMRASTLDNIARQFPKLTIIGAHLGNPDYAWAAEIARWNPNLYFDVSGSTLIKKQEDYTFFKSIFWWSGVVSPHTPKGGPSAFEKLVFGSDVFGGDLEEMDLELERYQKMLDACGVSKEAQANIFGGTMWRVLERQ